MENELEDYLIEEYKGYNGSTANDIIIKEKSPRKSLIGNNGDFNLANPNLYKGIFPLMMMTYGQENK